MAIDIGSRIVQQKDFRSLDKPLRSQIRGAEGYTFFGGNAQRQNLHFLTGDALNLFLGSQLDAATDPSQISPTGASPGLARVPRSGGSLLGTAAARSLSRSAFSRTRQQGLRKPLLAGA